MTERQLRYLPDEQIRSCLDMKKAIELMKEAFIQISARTVTIPVRTGISTSDGKGRTLFMPSYSPQLSAFGVKVVSVFPENDKKGLPVIQGKLLVLDGQTGTPTAMLDAEYLTALRTGAASGLASDCLAIKE
ncbi:MAG: hypothetical protein HC811_00565 [Flammeovirgaceae bacterium]|nr:hypothetical protein [Flammeovirgaceae bacterium]